MKRLILLLSLALLLSASGCEKASEVEASRRIAHAGGGINNEDYTDSFEAMDRSVKLGFTLIEIDFSWTADARLVCLHDWRGGYERFFGTPITKLPTLDEFKKLVREKSPYHLCTLDELIPWMENNPKAILVTDVKRENVAALKRIAQKIKGFEDRVIPQIYQPENYSQVSELGYKNIIWTLYKFRASEETILERAKNIGPLYGVTMPRTLAEAGLGRKLKDMGHYTYTHTVNSPEVLEHYRKLGIDDVYTDYLPSR
jgi:glycerophosphoryl diester phosphodiesterase